MGHPGILALTGLATTLLVVVPRTLPRVTWFDRAPGWGIACWLTAAVATAVAVAVAPILVELHLPLVGHPVADLVSGCRHLFTGPGTPLGRLETLGAVAVAASLPLWIAVRVGTAQVADARHRRLHKQGARLVAVDVDGGMLTLDHPVPVVYCVPGARSAIVVTTGARRRLTAAQLAAVQAHERAHLGARHHLACGLLEGLVQALPPVAVIRTSLAQVRRLVELAADDAATRDHPRDTLADALAAVRDGGGGLAAHRERRLRQAPAVRVNARHHAAALVAIMFAALSLGVVLVAITSHGADCSAHTIAAGSR